MFAGIDLAWGQRARTGLAVVDASGALIASASARTDADIEAFLAPYASALSTIAIDAPLVVTNPTGQRDCEAQIGAAFGRYGAGAYPANTANPHFNPPRAATLARTLDWAVDPAHRGGPGRPGCIEVYPHPAMVGLFELAYTIPYKGKRGRDLAFLKLAYEELLGHMERRLAVLRLDSNARWAELRAVTVAAARKADLERVEDEIDAIVCAHLAWLWSTQPETLRVYGGVDTGYIVAPPPPQHVAKRRLTQRPVVPDEEAGGGARGPLTTDLGALAETMVDAVPSLTLEDAHRLAALSADYFDLRPSGTAAHRSSP